MRRPRKRSVGLLLAGLLALVTALATLAPATAAAVAVDPVTTVARGAATTPAQQDKVESYWTTSRMRQATPAQHRIPDGAAANVARGEQQVVADAPAQSQPAAAAAAVSTTTGKVFFTLGGVDYVCSGSSTSSANRDVVSTAGHCVNEGPGAFATNWAFVPAYNNGSRPYGTWTARTLVTTSAWANQGDINYDGGFAVMNVLGGSHLTDVVGGQGIGFNLARGLTYTAYGYPAAPPFNGETLKSCSGTAQDDTFGGTQSQSIPCNMTGGSSGGPWFTGGVQNSVNSFGYTGVPNRMFGPYYGSAIQGAYNSAQNS
ncbi:MAG: hypothetical protein QOE40_3124 [Actinomycetota bacterium]|nr:hypothetical protein [Actinomycetota bacterium]